MPRKLLLTIIFGILIVLGAVLWFFFPRSTTSTQAPVVSSTVLPFGQGGANISLTTGSPSTGININTTGVDSQGKPIAKLFRITDQPVSGLVSFIRSGTAVVRFVDRATGHIYDVDPTTLIKTQITNNTYPKIEEAYFKNDGSAVLLRDVKNNSDSVENISLTLTAPKATTTDALYTVKATYLTGNVSSIAVGPTNSLVFGLKDSGSVDTSLFDGSKITNLFSSAFTSWLISWPTTNNILLTSKASSGISGYSYNLSTTNGALTKIAGPLDSLTATESPDGKSLAYSYIQNGQTIFTYEKLSDKSGYEILPTTFADKCVWSKSNASVIYCGTPSTTIRQNDLENWYKGITHFSDQIWRFNLLTDTSEVLAEPKKDFGIDIDTTNLALSPDESYLFFINKTDLTLWALKLQ